MAIIEHYSKGLIVETPDVAFTYQVSETLRDFDKLSNNSNTLNWNNITNYIGDYLIFPFGANNDLPTIIKDVVDNSYNVPGFLMRKTELLWGAGPKLYQEKIEDNKDVRVRIENTEINNWLKSWNYEEYLLKCCVDYQHVQGVFTRYELNKGYKGNAPFISKLHHHQTNQSRLARFRQSDEKKPTHIIVSDYNLSNINTIGEAKAYPIFDNSKPFEYPNAMMYSNMYTFCTNYYSVPQLYGSLEWINRSTAVPLLFKAFSKNSINLKYHIESPQGYWDKKEKQIKENCANSNQTYSEKMLLDFQYDFLTKIGDALSGDENNGKYIHTIKSLRVDGNNIIEEGWVINVLDQKVKDFVEAHILISQTADKAIAAGVNVHPVLANMTDSGKSNSGGEQIYALLNYLNTGVDIQEMIICKAVNTAIMHNFPNSNVKIGFFHNVPEIQSNISPKDRTKQPI